MSIKHFNDGIPIWSWRNLFFIKDQLFLDSFPPKRIPTLVFLGFYNIMLFSIAPQVRLVTPRLCPSIFLYHDIPCSGFPRVSRLLLLNTWSISPSVSSKHHFNLVPLMNCTKCSLLYISCNWTSVLIF